MHYSISLDSAAAKNAADQDPNKQGKDVDQYRFKVHSHQIPVTVGWRWDTRGAGASPLPLAAARWTS